MRFTTLVALFLMILTIVSCRDDFSRIEAEVESYNSNLRPELCGVITLYNQMYTHKRNQSNKKKRRIDVMSYAFRYEIQANEDAEDFWHIFKLGDEDFIEERKSKEDTCPDREYDDAGHCVNPGWKWVYQPVLQHGGSMVYEVKFDNLNDYTQEVPASIFWDISNMKIRTSDGFKEWTGLRIVGAQNLACYQQHIVTLHNTEHYDAPRAANNARVTTSASDSSTNTEENIGFSVLSSSLLTKEELASLDMVGKAELAAKRAGELKGYLIETLNGKSYTDIVLENIGKADLLDAYSAARKVYLGEHNFTNGEILLAFPKAKDILGSKLANDFAESIAQSIKLVNKIEAAE